MDLMRGPLPGTDQALELALAHAGVRAARAGRIDELLRVYRPSAPVVVFGRRDTRSPGFPGAVAAVRDAGFQPVVRATGGRAVAYTGEALVVDHVRHEPGAVSRQERRFEELGGLYVETFRRLGVDARLGAVPGEYCPGAHSVNARGVAKLVGTAQRVTGDAWLFSALVVVGDQERLRPLFAEVYAHLEQDLDPASVGALSAEVPGLGTDEVEAALLDTYAARGLTPAPLDDDLLRSAEQLVDQHRA